MRAAAEPAQQHRGPDADDEQTRGERQPRIERLGDDEPRKKQRDETEREDAGRVRHRHDRAKKHGVAGPALRPDEIPSHDRLAVPRGERVCGAPEGGEPEREQDRAQREVAAGDERLEAAALVRGGGGRVERGRGTGAATEREARRRRRHVERRAEELPRIRAQLVARALGRDAGAVELRAVARSHDDLAPADPRAEVAVAQRERRPRARRRDVDGVEPQRLEAAGAGPTLAPVLERAQPGGPAVDGELELARSRFREARRADGVAELEGRDLRQVEHVVDVDALARELDGRVPVDREVPERVRRGCGRRGEGGETGKEGEGPSHAASLRAVSLQRSEKWGFSSSARPNHSCASAGVAEAALDHAAVEVERGVLGAEAERPL